jgi:hypothetical protein
MGVGERHPNLEGLELEQAGVQDAEFLRVGYAAMAGKQTEQVVEFRLVFGSAGSSSGRRRW